MPTHLAVIETVKLKIELTLTQLFQSYLEFKKPAVKPTIFHSLVTSIQAYVELYGIVSGSIVISQYVTYKLLSANTNSI